ncbi:MAG: ABC transporter ATP-binding protein [Kofleriaceae bacterium]
MTAPACEVRELTVHYGKRVAVDHLSFELAPGEVALLLGPNGAGKSTALSALAGALLPTSGAVKIAGHDLAAEPLRAKRHIGFADQPPALYEFLTVSEHLEFVAAARGAGRADVDAGISALQLDGLAARPCRELSFGMRQRVGLAAALLGEVSLVLLDETLNGLDPYAARSARAAVEQAAQRGAAVLLSTHLLGGAERMCQRVIIMDQGRIVADRRGDELQDLLGSGGGSLETLYLSVVADRGPT